jgi:hypothetical protein
MISLILAGASIGVSLFQAREQTRAARQSAALEAARQGTIMSRVTFGGEMERMQIRTAAQASESFRRAQLGEALGAQRASMAAAGIIGGRTQQLLQARSQAAFTREQARESAQMRLQISASRYRESAAIQDAQTSTQQVFAGARQEARQANASFLGNALQTASLLV